MKGPRPATSAAGVAAVHVSRSLPASKAGRSLCAGRIGRLCQRARRARVVHRREREQHIVGREGGAVGEENILPQSQRPRPLIVGERPTFSECGLDLLGGVIELDELAVDQVRDDQRRAIANDEAIEAAGLGTDRGDQSAARHLARGCGGSRAQREPRGDAEEDDDESERSEAS
jgi:hypothetical protein